MHPRSLFHSMLHESEHATHDSQLDDFTAELKNLHAKAFTTTTIML